MNELQYLADRRNSAELLARAFYGEPLVSMGKYSNIAFMKFMEGSPVDRRALSNSKALIHWSYYKN